MGGDLDPSLPLSEAGFDSLLAVEFSQAVAAALSVRLAPTLIFDCPTLNAVAAHIAVQKSSAALLQVGLPLIARLLRLIGVKGPIN